MTQPTPDHLSRLIALHFEPEPTWTYSDYKGPELTCGSPYISDGGFWVRVIGTQSYVTPEPRPYTDPEISMRLLKALLEQFVVPIYFAAGQHLVICIPRSGPDGRFEVAADALERAILLAFAKSVGIETEE